MWFISSGMRWPVNHGLRDPEIENSDVPSISLGWLYLRDPRGAGRKGQYPRRSQRRRGFVLFRWVMGKEESEIG